MIYQNELYKMAEIGMIILNIKPLWVSLMHKLEKLKFQNQKWLHIERINNSCKGTELSRVKV